MTEMTQVVESDYSERVKIESWRLHVLIEAGYPTAARREARPLDGRPPPGC